MTHKYGKREIGWCLVGLVGSVGPIRADGEVHPCTNKLGAC